MSARKTRPARSPVARRQRRKSPPDKPDRGGRPAIVWDDAVAADVHKLARAGNTLADMASILAVSKSSLEAAIADESLPVRVSYYTGIADRRDAIRTAQLRLALRGNAQMLIWLGKQDLEQREPARAVEITGAGGGTLKVESDLGPVVKKKLTEFLRSQGKK